jgi:hypothetical protein
MLHEEESSMVLRKSLVLIAVTLLIATVSFPGFAQAPRGKAELKNPAGNVTVDYGRPSLKGRDMLSQLPDKDFWRMGMDQATVLTTPVDLTFGTVKVPKGSYSLWLQKAGDGFNLVFNSQTGQWGTNHDPSKDVYKVPMTKAALPAAVEAFTIDLKGASGGGMLEMSWGMTKLSANFQFAK